jgi:hypothetical protein
MAEITYDHTANSSIESRGKIIESQVPILRKSDSPPIPGIWVEWENLKID